MVIQHNIASMDTARNYNANQSKIGRSLEKLSSGYKINRAGDDAAGLAVTEKMRAQIHGIRQAVRNCSDGISLIQTFEGALDQTVTIIKRMKTLAVQSANGTYCNEIDRTSIQVEFGQLGDEINHIADTDFNGIVMLNGRHMSDTFSYLSDSGVVQTAPEKLEWSSYVNNTNIPDTNMTIKKLEPGMAGVTDYDKYIFESIAMLENAEISADLKNGFPEYYFSGIDIPPNFSIRTEDNYGIITYHAPDGISADVAQVYLPEIPHNAFSKATGIWDDGENGYGVIDVPGAFSACDTVEKREEYQTWIESIIPATVTVNDDLETYTAADGTEYKKGELKLPITSIPNTKALISWSDDIIKPGDTITVSGNTFNSIPTSYTMSQTIKISDGDETNDFQPVYQTKYQDFTIGYVTAEKARKYWINNGNGDSTITLEFKYNTSTGKWLGNSPDNYTDELGISSKDIASSLADARAKGITKNDILSFTININKCFTGYSRDGLTWHNGSPNGDFSMGEYDKNHPEKGGIDYRVAEDGAVYTYVNESYISTVAEGHWEDAEGNRVNLESVGVYLPSVPKDGSREPDTDILHNGMQIKVTNPLNGATGTVTGKLHFWDSQTDAFRAGYENLTYADDLVIQAGGRTKDLVAFTFEYSAGGIDGLEADLNCTAKGLGIDTLDVTTQKNANYAIDRLNIALLKASMVRSSFGAAQNRLEHKIDNLNNISENITQAESRIRDADMAEEMREFTKNQILTQASQTMLAQANSLPQGVMRLLGEQ